jgi:hypothetical protein
VSDERLRELGERIELLATDPERVRSRWASLVGPILRLVGWEPTFEVEAATELLARVRSLTPGARKAASALQAKRPAAPVMDLLRDALSELEENIESAERACVVHGSVPTSRAAWLRRLFEVLARASKAVQKLSDKSALRLAAGVDPVMIAPPLAIRREPPTAEGDAPAKAAPEMDPGDARLLELHLSAVDHLLDAARSETAFLGRRRRLLEASRKLLLDASAALPLDPRGVEVRRAHIAEQIVRINRLEAAGISPEVGLLHQAKTALSRGDRARLHAALGALDRMAVQGGDERMARSTSAALTKLWGGRSPMGDEASERSLELSTKEVLGEALLDSVRDGYRAAREELSRSLKAASPEQAAELASQEKYLVAGSEDATLAAALVVDGCFDVGGVLAPVRVEEHEERIRAVGYPTQELMLVPARDVADVPSAIIDDPRRILLSLAEGRLLARKFIKRERVTRARTRLVGEARIYLLDGSDSMLTAADGRAMGARARMRDAILLAELSTLHRRYLELGPRVRVSLYYRYFTKVLWPLVKVDSADAAMKAMVEVLKTPRRGGTDIEGALLASFDLVREARASDPDLARAQIVLVTDGDARVREEVLKSAREKVGDMPVGVSVIALGEENASLRAMVARQRSRGERAFYHFMDDQALSAIAEGRVDSGPAIHLDSLLSGDSARAPSEVAAELEREVGDLLDDLGSLGEERRAEALDEAAEGAKVMDRALDEVGLSRSVSEGERARREALDRDQRALSRRFSRWFPEPLKEGGAAVGEGSGASGRALPEGMDASDRSDIDASLIALATVAEVVSEVGGGAMSKRADAIEVLERLLPDARLSPARYLAVLRAYPGEVAAALRAVHAAVGPKRS